ncbi:MAG: tRNA (cytidine(34)-2'-O)-methyltransferase [Bdellovibrionaceae bacterium]|nr:tRNA (cytidine(34)-2'-O)-methyltransferase [Pseudobdellovibrionaceae bacterium]
MLNIVLVEPEIPHNTGNIARTCVAMNCHLHLVGPLGFSIDDKQVRRAGLDYWPHLKLTTYNSWAEFQSQQAATSANRVYFTTKSAQDFYDYHYSVDSWLVFGPETRGLSADILHENAQQCVRIPMIGAVRSLNLSNAVAIGVYEVFRHNRAPLP